MIKRIKNGEEAAQTLFAMASVYVMLSATAYVVSRAAMQYLDFTIGWAIILAVGIELTGIVSVANALTAHEWNATKREGDPAAPQKTAIAAMMVYFVTIIVLTVTLESFGEHATYSFALLPFLGITAAYGQAFRVSHQKRVSAVATETGEKELKQGQANLKRATTLLKQGQAELKQGRLLLKQDSAELKRASAEVEQRGADLKQAESKAEQDGVDLEQRIMELKRRETETAVFETALKKVNPLSLDIIRYIGGSDDTMQAIADRNGVGKTAVNRQKVAMNGHGG